MPSSKGKSIERLKEMIAKDREETSMELLHENEIIRHNGEKETLSATLDKQIEAITEVPAEKAKDFRSKHGFLPVSFESHVEDLVELVTEGKNDEFVNLLPTALPSEDMPEIKVTLTNDGWFDTYSITVKTKDSNTGYKCLATKESLEEELKNITASYWDQANINELYKNEGIIESLEIDNEEEEERE